MSKRVRSSGRSIPAVLAGVLLLALPGASLAAPGVACTATAHLDDAVAFGSLQVEVTYTPPDVSFDGSGSSVACTNLSAALGSFDDDDAGLVTAGFIAFGPASGPTDLMVCDVTAAAPITAGDLSVSIVDASDPSANPISPLPSASLNVDCGGSTTTTISLPVGSTTTTSTSMPPPGSCLVTFGLQDAVTLASLQLTVDYSAAGGTFEGDGAAVVCEALIPAFPSFADDDANQILNAAFISLGGFTGPIPVARCSFVADFDAPLPGDFVVTVTDASDPLLQPISPLPSVAVTSVFCVGDTTTTTTTLPVCGDGIPQAGEECDDGLANSDVLPDACRTDCTLPGCGDGVTDAGEECDDGAGNSDTQPDACRTDCTLPVCGDDVTDTGEQCDDGSANSNTKADTCRMDCTTPVCGDGVTDSGEQCDDGAGNSDVLPDACRTDCVAAYCGDGVVDGGEQCDDGASNGPGEACTSSCTVYVAICGDGNGDGKLNVTDAQYILYAAVGLVSACPMAQCDANGDAKLTVVDAQAILRKVIGIPVTLICGP